MSDSETLAQRLVEHPLTDLAAVSEGEVQRIIQVVKPNSSSLDPIPNAHIPTLIHLINVSFKSGTVPRKLKKAVIILLLKSLPWTEIH